MFAENESVIYKDFVGTIAFVGTDYLVIEIPPKDIGRNAARLIVYRYDYDKIILQDSK